MTVIQWYPGHMAKAKRLMEEDIKIVDMSLVVLDARIPFSSYNPDFNRILAKKPMIMVLNKQDLANTQMTKQWLAYFKQQGHGAVAINAQQSKGMQDLQRVIMQTAEPLFAELEAKGRRRRPVRVMVAGSPNTGKSTLINSLAPKAVSKTGNKPGVTRGKQWVRFGDQIELLDTPGVLWPKFEQHSVAFRLAATGAISETVYDYYQVALELLDWLRKFGAAQLCARYKLQPEQIVDCPVEQVLEAVGRSRGLLAAGGVVRPEETARLLLAEFRNGKIGRFTLDVVPGRRQGEANNEA